MRQLWQDLAYEVRLLVKSPVVVIVTVLTFALGIGATAAIFGVVKAVLLRPLPGTEQPEKLLLVASRTKSGQIIPLSYPVYKELRDRNPVFATLAASAMTPMSLSTGGPAGRVWGELVSGNYFESLGTPMARGRPVLPTDDRAPGASPVCVISYALWQNRFGADPQIVGRAIRLNGHPFTIVGVARETFRGSMVGLSFDVFVPLMMQEQIFAYDVHGNILDQPNTYWLITQGRLKPGIAVPTAQAAMNVLGDQMKQLYPGDDIAQRAALVPLWRSPFGAQTFLLPVASVLMVIALLVLLLACANITTLLLARASKRSGEVAVRLALGVGRLRLFGQLLAGSLMLTLLGAGAGLAGAAWTSRLLLNLPGPNGVPVALNAGVDAPVFVFALALAVLSGLLIGVVPAARMSRLSLMAALNRESGARVASRSWLRSSLVVAQVAMSLVLLISATLLIRSFERTRAVDPGFNPQHALLLSLDLKGNDYNQQTGWTFCRRLLQSIKSVPGVDEASLMWQLPLSGFGPAAPSASVAVEGYVPRKDEDAMIFHYNVVGPDYLRSMGIPLKDGREFTPRDDAESLPVVVINETMARRFWAGQNPIGKRLMTGGAWRTVAGVAADSKYLSMSEQPQPYFYLPYFQSYQPQVTLQVRTAGPPLALQSVLQDSMQRLDASLPVLNVRTLDRQVDRSFARVQQIAALLTGAGLVGLLLAVIGVYGVMAQSVAEGMPAYGIRMAMGARAEDVFRLVLTGGFRLAVMGVALGLLLSLAGTRALRGLLVGVSPTDPATFGGISLMFALVVLVACWIPARRAARVQPMELLRHQ